jgi:hypothetical protein
MFEMRDISDVSIKKNPLLEFIVHVGRGTHTKGGYPVRDF